MVAVVDDVVVAVVDDVVVSNVAACSNLMAEVIVDVDDTASVACDDGSIVVSLGSDK